MNPLAGYFRQPAIYTKLPSNGRWWTENSIELPANGEIPVYPMTTKDEIVLRTPDALLNGQGVVDVIQSCCPTIKNAWDMPGIDVDTVLIAIRIATYGNKMEFESKCPHCGEDNKHDVELGAVMSSIACPNYNDMIPYRDLKIKLKPQRYFGINQGNQISFEEQKIVNALNAIDIDPNEKGRQLTESMQRLVDLGLSAVANSTDYIELADGTRITNIEHINEFFNNAESSVVRDIQNKLEQFAEQTKVKPLNLQCNECTKPYTIELTFDYANFFGKGF